MLKIVIQEFLPKLYDRYVEINVKYKEKHKKYETVLPPFLKNRPRKIIDQLLDRMGKVESDGINYVEIVGENIFNATSSDLSSTHRLKCRVDFGDKDQFCSCTCNGYRRNRMLCKHFFTVIDSSRSNFHNISKLFLEHPYINLDSALFERKTNEKTIVSNTETKFGNHKEESSPKLLENDCPVEDVNAHMDFQLPLRQTELKTAKINFRVTLKELYDLSYLMKDTENVKNHAKTINLMVRQIKQNIKGSKILLERNSPKKRKLLKIKTVKKKTKRLKSEPKQLFNKNIKH